MILTAKDCWAAGRKSHNTYFDETVSTLRKKFQTDLTQAVYDFLVQNHATIRDGNESDFRKLQRAYINIYNSLSDIEKLKVGAAICKIFDYGAFSRKCKKRWCAYKLCASSNIMTCPYCNLSQEVTIIIGSDGKIRPALDHFFDKARYPLFAISLGNLIPSCHHCNSTFKGAKDFLVSPHLNPICDNESIKFSLDVDAIDARIDIRKLDNANVKLIYNKKSTKEINSVETFQILQQYQARASEIRQIVKNMVTYSSSGKSDPLQREWVLRNITPGNYRNRIYGKLFLDFSADYM